MSKISKVNSSKSAPAKDGKNQKVVIRKKAAKPMTPDELAQRATANKPKSKHFDLSVLRAATGSTEPIHLFRAIRALGPKHIPAIIHLLQGAEKIKENSSFSLMQPVYVIIDGTGAYINDYCLSYVIDADASYIRCINAEGTMIASFPTDSTSIITTTDFIKIEKDLKPANEKPIRTKTPLVGATDFEPPTINDAVLANRIPKKRLAHSDLYTLFASFSEGTKLTLGTVNEGEKKKKKKKRNTDQTDTTNVELQPTTITVTNSKNPQELKEKSNRKLDAARKKMLLELDLSGYDPDPETDIETSNKPTKKSTKESDIDEIYNPVAAKEKSRKEMLARLAKASEDSKTFTPLTPATKEKHLVEVKTKGKKSKLKNKKYSPDTIKTEKPKKVKEVASTIKKKSTKKVQETITEKESLAALKIFGK